MTVIHSCRETCALIAILLMIFAVGCAGEAAPIHTTRDGTNSTSPHGVDTPTEQETPESSQDDGSAGNGTPPPEPDDTPPNDDETEPEETPTDPETNDGPVCGDGVCAPGQEDCGTCLGDCPCPTGSSCDNHQCVAGPGPECGDGVCTPGQEDCGTCLGDCPCPGGSSCDNHQCVGDETPCIPASCSSLGMECGSANDGCGGTLNCGNCPEGNDCDLPPLGAPGVGLNDQSLEDNSGPFLGLGATLFWAAWGYKYDRPKLRQNLEFLADSGFNYIRALGVVGDMNGPDYWDGREIDFNWPDYADVISGLTDLAYDEYGLRVEWTLIGDGQVTVPDLGQKYALANTFLAMSVGREHKILHFETANEYWINGFEGNQGLQELRDLTAYLRANTDILVAASAPDGHECDDARSIYDGCVADIATVHFDRSIHYVEGPWRPVRQPWEHQFCAIPAGSNNEPIGPGASVESETDPLLLVSGAIVSYLAGLPMHVFHSSAGVRGFQNLMDMPGAGSFSNLHSLLPPDLASWNSQNAHWSTAPFVVYAGDESGNLHANDMWVDWSNPTSGVVRAYGATKGHDFVVFPMGILGSVTLEPRTGMDFAVIDPITGATLACHSMPAGQRFQLSGASAFLIKGSFWCGEAPCTPSDCVADPGGTNQCGNQSCAPGIEDCGNCPGDCPCPNGTTCQNHQCVATNSGPTCGDNACAPGVEDCGTCPGDCPCPSGTACEGHQCFETTSEATCGDNACAPGIEDCGTCPGDCPCPPGTACQSHQCVENEPTSTAEGNQTPELPADFSGVIWLHTNPSNWAQTATLSSVTLNDSNICLNYNKANVWPGVEISENTIVNANPWIFVYQDGVWYAGTWEWMRVDQTCKARTSVAGDHIKKDPLKYFAPEPGQSYYFMVTGLARLPGVTNVQQRSNPVRLTWPSD